MVSVADILLSTARVILICGEFLNVLAQTLQEVGLDLEIPAFVWGLFFLASVRRPRLCGALRICYAIFQKYRFPVVHVSH